ncbi:hypothetical protein L2E82_26733 [Cichorium intybus]|uniref:Uncharacterized protein n=1 Tax=Cichorium intybus TaxID=13427 RepID=A0ACB9CQZ3_CICIN|nr:hypothetical protein L2E82_26733 [Cichorium intybus]
MQLTIEVRHLPTDKHLSGENEGKLWMWSCCGKCNPFNGSLKCTKRVLVSTSACSLSFGKFLELGFSNHSSCDIKSSCGHLFYKDYFHFFRHIKMYTSMKKISKDKDVEPTEFEQKALFDLENTHQELKSDLKDLYINSASQIDVANNKKAVVIHVPYRLTKQFRKIHPKLVRELEKKFSGKDVVFIATRRIVRPPKKGSAAQRPRSRTLTAVHDAMLEDIVHPAEIKPLFFICYNLPTYQSLFSECISIHFCRMPEDCSK